MNHVTRLMSADLDRRYWRVVCTCGWMGPPLRIDPMEAWGDSRQHFRDVEGSFADMLAREYAVSRDDALVAVQLANELVEEGDLMDGLRERVLRCAAQLAVSGLSRTMTGAVAALLRWPPEQVWEIPTEPTLNLSDAPPYDPEG